MQEFRPDGRFDADPLGATDDDWVVRRACALDKGDAMSDMAASAAADRYDWAEDPTAQDVIDALRLALMAQKEPAKAFKIVELLVEFAPETDSGRGIDLLLRLISEASLKVEVVDA